MNKGKVTVIMDAQAGSCGKGKLIGYLALRELPVAAINNFMSNAGHTYVDPDGEKIMTQHLPTSMVNPSTFLLIGPGAAITPDILISEIVRYRRIIGRRHVIIHPRAMLILEKHREQERQTIRSGSTFKGCGAAQAEKIMRVPGTILIGSMAGMEIIDTTIGENYGDNPELCDYIRSRIVVEDTAQYLNEYIDIGGDVIIEGSQGFDLDINYGLGYPHTTSRQCNAGQLVADCGIAPQLVTDTIMIMRPYPIRISNQTNIGIEVSSGEYAGSPEITWDIVKDRCGAPDDIQFGEMTTVTKKMRRVFELNWDRLQYACTINRPTAIALNFAQYLDWSIHEKNNQDLADGFNLRDTKVWDFINLIYKKTRVPVKYIGTGARNCDIIDLSEV